jgi:hypothetical protein
VFLQAHPWFKGLEWEKLYQMEAAFIPEVNDELDTQNFEKFEEIAPMQTSSKAGPWRKVHFFAEIRRPFAFSFLYCQYIGGYIFISKLLRVASG